MLNCACLGEVAEIRETREDADKKSVLLTVKVRHSKLAAWFRIDECKNIASVSLSAVTRGDQFSTEP